MTVLNERRACLYVQWTYTTILEYAVITLGTVAVVAGSRIETGPDWLDCVVAHRLLIGAFHWTKHQALFFFFFFSRLPFPFPQVP